MTRRAGSPGATFHISSYKSTLQTRTHSGEAPPDLPHSLRSLAAVSL
jgi:hypothetical protein